MDRNALNVNELNLKAMEYGFTIHNDVMANWQYYKPIQVYFSKLSPFKIHPNPIVPPDIISFENVNHLTLFDNEFEGNLKTHILLSLELDDASIDIGSVSLKIFDFELEEEDDDQVSICFICGFD